MVFWSNLFGYGAHHPADVPCCLFVLLDSRISQPASVAGQVGADAGVGARGRTAGPRVHLLPAATGGPGADAAGLDVGLLREQGVVARHSRLRSRHGHHRTCTLTGCDPSGRALVLMKRVAMVQVGNSRKVLAILLSFVVFPKPLASEYVLGTVCFGVGVLLNTYADNPERRKAS